jgi:ABC-type uncharacterized transport system substrate-binding protein
MEGDGLISYGVNFIPMYRRAATFAAKILKGAKPADLPIEQATKFELVINFKVAKTEPPQVCRRPVGLSHAAMAGFSSMA